MSKGGYLYSNIYIVKSNNENVFVDCLIDGYCSFYGMLKQMYDEEFERALSQDEDRSSFRVAPYLRNGY